MTHKYRRKLLVILVIPTSMLRGQSCQNKISTSSQDLDLVNVTTAGKQRAVIRTEHSGIHKMKFFMCTTGITKLHSLGDNIRLRYMGFEVFTKVKI